MKQKVAVFDVDGTIFRSSLLVEVVDELISREIFPKRARRMYEKQHELWLNREGDYEDYIMAVVEAFKKHLKGVYYGDFADASAAMVGDHWMRTYSYTRNLLKDLKLRGYYLLAVSHSPKTVLDKFCPRLGFNKSYGIVYEIGPEHRFNGSIVDEHLIFNKANILLRAVKKENLTLTHSIGVGDTESDIPFLEMVARPICFNPNKNLYSFAKRNGWSVIVERKDVIYHL